MAKKPKIHPSLTNKGSADEEEDVLIGGPEHGDPWEHAWEDPEDPDDLDDPDEEVDGDEVADPVAARLERMERDMLALRSENDMLRRSIPPAQPIPAEPEPEDDVDWESMLFTDPAKALALRDERVEKRITKKLRGEYNREQSQARFWDDFYAKNTDLDRGSDHDIVEATLHSNMANLSPMPTDAAIAELGDLTRRRIMQYSKRSDKKRTRRMAEGASPPRPKKAKREPDDNKVTSISDLVRARRNKRVSAA